MEKNSESSEDFDFVLPFELIKKDAMVENERGEREGFFDTGFGYSIKFYLTGNPQANEKVLMVMGFGGDHRYWDPLPQMIHKNFPGRYEVCTFDARGSGKSTESFLSWTTTQTFARDALLLILHLQWVQKNTPIHLCGWSMGGFSCLEAVTAILNNVKDFKGKNGLTLNIASLLLANTDYKFSLPSIEAMKIAMRICLASIPNLLLRRKMSNIAALAVKLHFSQQFLEKDDNLNKLTEIYAQSRFPMDRALTPTVVRTLIGHAGAGITHQVSEENLQKIKASGLPVHAILSKDDLLIHPTGSTNLANMLGCSYTKVGGGHNAQFEQTESFFKAMIENFEKGLQWKFPFLKRSSEPHPDALSKSQSMFSIAKHGKGAADNREVLNVNFPWASPSKPVELLFKIVKKSKRNFLIESLLKRLKNPTTMVLMGVLFATLLIETKRRISTSRSQKEKIFQIFFIFYILIFVLYISENARSKG